MCTFAVSIFKRKKKKKRKWNYHCNAPYYQRQKNKINKWQINASFAKIINAPTPTPSTSPTYSHSQHANNKLINLTHLTHCRVLHLGHSLHLFVLAFPERKCKRDLKTLSPPWGWLILQMTAEGSTSPTSLTFTVLTGAWLAVLCVFVWGFSVESFLAGTSYITLRDTGLYFICIPCRMIHVYIYIYVRNIYVSYPWH